MNRGGGCEPCEWEAEGDLRLFAARDVLDAVVWRRIENPVDGVDMVIVMLRKARQAFLAAGFEPGEQA